MQWGINISNSQMYGNIEIHIEIGAQPKTNLTQKKFS
jgi:hypothetical protein